MADPVVGSSPLGTVEDAALSGLDAAASLTGSSLVGAVAGSARSLLGRLVTRQFSSTCISAISWDPGTLELTVTFARDGSEYIFSGVPESVVNGFDGAGSIGEYFHRVIKGVY